VGQSTRNTQSTQPTKSLRALQANSDKHIQLRKLQAHPTPSNNKRSQLQKSNVQSTPTNPNAHPNELNVHNQTSNS
jgi:hypothetical protein